MEGDMEDTEKEAGGVIEGLFVNFEGEGDEEREENGVEEPDKERIEVDVEEGRREKVRSELRKGSLEDEGINEGDPAPVKVKMLSEGLIVGDNEFGLKVGLKDVVSEREYNSEAVCETVLRAVEDTTNEEDRETVPVIEVVGLNIDVLVIVGQVEAVEVTLVTAATEICEEGVKLITLEIEAVEEYEKTPVLERDTLFVVKCDGELVEVGKGEGVALLEKVAQVVVEPVILSESELLEHAEN